VDRITDPQFDRLRKAIDVLRLFDRQVPAQVISTFFYVASHDGCTGNDVSKALNMTSSSVSRCTDWLSDYHRLGKPGMGLIVKKKDNLDQRSRTLHLTPKGEMVINQIRDILNS
jgi:DNA-binding MarR family transcriptional regulator